MGGTVRLSKGRFLAAFLGLFAALLVGWQWTGAARYYNASLLAVAAVLGPMVHGWLLQSGAPGSAPVWVRGADQVQAAIQFDALAVGVVPALALVGATPGFRLARRVLMLMLALALCFVVDVLLVSTFPLLVFYKNPFTDVLGTYVGLIAFVGAPVIIWFVLAFQQLRLLLPSLQTRR